MTTQPADPAGDTGTADLIGYGRIAWSQLRAMLGGAPAAWADYEGFHIQPAPSDPPPYTHLWAWTDHWLIRARIDGDTAITAALALPAQPETTAAPVLREQVSYRCVTARTWPEDEPRVGPLAPGVPGRPATLYLIAGTRPVTFVSLSPRT